MQASGPYVRLYSSVWCVWCVETVGVLAVFPDCAIRPRYMPYLAYGFIGRISESVSGPDSLGGVPTLHIRHLLARFWAH